MTPPRALRKAVFVNCIFSFEGEVSAKIRWTEFVGTSKELEIFVELIKDKTI